MGSVTAWSTPWFGNVHSCLEVNHIVLPKHSPREMSGAPCSVKLQQTTTEVVEQQNQKQ